MPRFASGSASRGVCSLKCSSRRLRAPASQLRNAGLFMLSHEPLPAQLDAPPFIHAATQTTTISSSRRSRLRSFGRAADCAALCKKRRRRSARERCDLLRGRRLPAARIACRSSGPRDRPIAPRQIARGDCAHDQAARSVLASARGGHQPSPALEQQAQ